MANEIKFPNDLERIEKLDNQDAFLVSRIDGTYGYMPLSEAKEFKGEPGAPFTFEDFTPEQILGLQKPATDAADSVEKVTQEASDAAQIATQKAIYAGQKGDYANQQAEAAKEAATTIGDRIDMGLAALVGAAPDALDTLVELAEAIGNDPNFAQTMLNEIAKRAMANDPRLSDARDVINQAGGAIKIWTGSQAQYNAIAKQGDTLYFIS